MSDLKKNCRNMNHGRENPPVKYCPNCGDKLKSNSSAVCDDEKHKARRKDRSHFCHDCGKDLTKG